MGGLSQEQASSREKTLFSAFALSLPGPLVTGFAAASSRSATQLADFIRRTTELLALGVSWWVFRKLNRGATPSEDERARLERLANRSVAAAMCCSGVAMLIVAVSRLAVARPSGNVSLGLTIAVLGLIINGWFWRRYAAMTRETFNAVIESQRKLYLAKTSVDLCVVAALTAVAVAPTHPATRYIDVAGSGTVALYLLYSGLRSAKSASSDDVTSRPM